MDSLSHLFPFVFAVGVVGSALTLIGLVVLVLWLAKRAGSNPREA